MTVIAPQELSVLNDPREKKTGPNTSGQNPNAGWYNRFVQTGKSDHETKTGGCFGGYECLVSHYTHPVAAHASHLVNAAASHLVTAHASHATVV